MLAYIDLIAFATKSNAARRRFLSATGLSLSRLGISILEAVRHDDLQISALAIYLQTDLTQVSRQTAQLVRMGLVTKRNAILDRRRVQVEATTLGTAVLDRWEHSWKTEMRTPLESWRTEEIALLHELLSLVCERLGAALTHLSQPSTQEFSTIPIAPAAGGRGALDACLSTIAKLVGLIGHANFDAALESAGVEISELEFLILRDIETFGPTPVGHIAQRLDQTQSAVSRALAGAALQSFVNSVYVADRRKRALTINEAGMRMCTHIRDVRCADLRTVLAGLSDSKARHYRALTDRYLRDLLTTSDTAASRYL